MLETALKQRSPDETYLFQKRDSLMRIIPKESPLVNNLELRYGREHFQKLKDVLPSQLQVIKSKDENDFIEIDLEGPLEKTSVDLSKDEFTLTELLSMKTNEYPFLVENLIPDKAITFLAGDSDAGKSLLYTQLCIAITEKRSEFLGLKLNTEHNRVIVLNSEDNPIAVTVRVKLQYTGKVISKSATDEFRIITNGQDSFKRIEKILQNYPSDLVVIDAFTDVFENDLNSANAVRSFLQSYSDLINKYGCTILFVHHIGKSNNKKFANKSQMLGSVGLHGKARNVINLSKSAADPNVKYLTITKGNYLSEDVKKKRITLEFDPKTLLHKIAKIERIQEIYKKEAKVVDNPEGINAKVFGRRFKTENNMFKAYQFRSQGLTLDEIAEKLDKNKSTISRYLKDYQPYDLSRARPIGN